MDANRERQAAGRLDSVSIRPYQRRKRKPSLSSPGLGRQPSLNPEAMHNVVALVVPDVIIFDLAIPAEIFGRAVEHERYAFTVCTEQPGRVRSTSGFDVEIGSGLGAIEVADTVLLAGARSSRKVSARAAAHVLLELLLGFVGERGLEHPPAELAEASLPSPISSGRWS